MLFFRDFTQHRLIILYSREDTSCSSANGDEPLDGVAFFMH